MSRVCENPACGRSLDGHRKGKRHCNSSCRGQASRYRTDGGDSGSQRFWDAVSHAGRPKITTQRREATR